MNDSRKKVTEAILERGARQLLRLQVLLDVVFGLLLIGVFSHLPTPSKTVWATESAAEILKEISDGLMVVVVGVATLLVYWHQNNKMLGNLARTDGRHAALSVIQVTVLLVYLYFIEVSAAVDKGSIVLALQSASLALAGLVGSAAWGYATRDRRLLTAALDDAEVLDTRISTLVEPITALVTLPFAWVGNAAWGLS